MPQTLSTNAMRCVPLYLCDLKRFFNDCSGIDDIAGR